VSNSSEMANAFQPHLTMSSLRLRSRCCGRGELEGRASDSLEPRPWHRACPRRAPPIPTERFAVLPVPAATYQTSLARPRWLTTDSIRYAHLWQVQVRNGTEKWVPDRPSCPWQARKARTGPHDDRREGRGRFLVRETLVSVRHRVCCATVWRF